MFHNDKKNIESLHTSLTHISKMTKSLRDLTLCQNPNILKGPEDVTQEDMREIHNLNSGVAMGIQDINDVMIGIVNSLQEYQDAEVKANKERKKLSL